MPGRPPNSGDRVSLPDSAREENPGFPHIQERDDYKGVITTTRDVENRVITWVMTLVMTEGDDSQSRMNCQGFDG